MSLWVIFTPCGTKRVCPRHETLVVGSPRLSSALQGRGHDVGGGARGPLSRTNTEVLLLSRIDTPDGHR